MAAGTGAGWRLGVGLVLVLAVVVVGAVLLVRQARSGDEAAETPVAATATTTPTAPPPSLGPSPSPSAADEPSPSAPTARPTAQTSTSAAPTEDPATEVPASPAGPTTKPAQPLDEPEEVRRGLTAEVTRLEAVAGEANGPGEVAGPALRATVTLSNDTGGRVDLSNTVVSLYYGDDETPASPLSGPGTRALPARVAQGEEASGRFVFALPADARADVLITVDYSVDTPVVAFRGRAPS